MTKPGFQSSLRDTDTQERDIWINEPPNAGQWRHQSFALIHEKVKHDFQLANNFWTTNQSKSLPAPTKNDYRESRSNSRESSLILDSIPVDAGGDLEWI